MHYESVSLVRGDANLGHASYTCHVVSPADNNFIRAVALCRRIAISESVLHLQVESICSFHSACSIVTDDLTTVLFSTFPVLQKTWAIAKESVMDSRSNIALFWAIV